MEVSVQPSFTFPSRKVYANRALGLQALINLQQLTTVPKRATDISLETGLQPSTTVPKTLDKDAFRVPSVLPVVPPQYVQPGQAEGLTHVAQSQQYELQILRVVSANNALKRGNYKSAESILGRQLTAEEITNKTVTPNVRATESGQKVHVGNHINAVGSQMRSGVSKEQGDFELRFAAEPFFNDLAASLNLNISEAQALRMGIPFPVQVTPGQAARLKTAFGYVGDLDFSEYGASQSRESRARQVGAMYDAILDHMTSTHEARLEKQKLQQAMEGMRYRNNREREDRREAHAPQENNAPGEVGDDQPLGGTDEEKEGELEGEEDEPLGAPQRNVFDEEKRAATPASQPVGVRSALDAEYFVDHMNPRNVQGIFDPDFRGSSRNPVEQVLGDGSGAPYIDPTVRNVFHPAYGYDDGTPMTEDANVLDQARVNVPIPGVAANDGLGMKVDQLEEAQRTFARTELKQEAEAEVVPADEGLDIDEKAMIVLSAPRGRRRRELLQDEGQAEGQALLKFARNNESQEPGRGTKRSRTAWSRMAREHGPSKYRRIDERRGGGGIDVGALSTHHGNRRSYSKRHDRGNPYADDRFLPDAESYDPRGAVVSGNLMRRTGTDAMAISAQLQVPETHQWTELPVRRFRQFPDMTDETRTDLIPIAQNTGGGSTRTTTRRGVGRTGRVPFGRYLLDMGQLSGGVVAMVHHGTGRKIRSFPNRPATKGLAHALSAVVSGGRIDHKKMSHHDKLYMNRLVKLSGADVDLPSDVNMPPGEQLKVLLGEIDAGNDSADIKHQLRSVVTSLKRMKQLSPEQAGQIVQHYL